MDQFAAIRTFIRIVETGSLTKAAESLDLPKSTTSKLLADLEASLETKLLARSTRSVALTAEGAAYYDQVVQVISRLGEADASIRDKGASPKGRVRVDVPSAFAGSILIPVLHEFREAYPDIQLAIGISDRPVGLIEEGVDCVVRLGALPDASLIARTIYQDRLITCASPDYLAARGVPRSPSDLDGHDLIGYFSAATGSVRPLVFRRGDEVVECAGTALLSNDSAGLLRMAAAGLGIGQVYMSAASDLIESGDLVSILKDWTRDTAPISVVFPPNKALNLRTRTFIDWLASRFSK